MEELIVKVGANLAGFERGIASVGKSVAGLSVQIAKWGAITAGAGLAASTWIGAKFQNTLMETATVAQAFDEDLKALENQARKLGTTTAFSATQAAGGMYDLASAGFKTKEIIDAIENSVKLAGATNSDLALATEVVASSIKQFNMQASESKRIVDTYSTAITNSLFTLDKLSDAMRYAGTTGGSLGWTIEQTTAAVAQFIDLGLRGEQAGTGFRLSMGMLAKGGTEVQEVLKELHLEYSQVNPVTQRFGDILLELGKAGLTSQQALRMFGQEAGMNMLQLSKLAMQGKTDYEGFVNTLIKGQEGIGRTAEMYDRMMDTFLGQWRILLGIIQELAISVFDIYKEEGKEALKILGKSVGELTQKLKDNQYDIKLFMFESANTVMNAALMMVKGFDIIKEGANYATEYILILAESFEKLRLASYTFQRFRNEMQQKAFHNNPVKLNELQKEWQGLNNAVTASSLNIEGYQLTQEKVIASRKNESSTAIALTNDIELLKTKINELKKVMIDTAAIDYLKKPKESTLEFLKYMQSGPISNILSGTSPMNAPNYQEMIFNSAGFNEDNPTNTGAEKVNQFLKQIETYELEAKKLRMTYGLEGIELLKAQHQVVLIEKEKEFADLAKEDGANLQRIAKVKKEMFETLNNQYKLDLDKANREQTEQAYAYQFDILKARDQAIKDYNDSMKAFESSTTGLSGEALRQKDLQNEIDGIRSASEAKIVELLKYSNTSNEIKNLEAATTEEINKRILASDKAVADARKQTLMDTLNSTVDNFRAIAEAGGKYSKQAFMMYKAAAITQALINTYTSATGIFKNIASTPFLGPFALPLAVAGAAAAVAAGMAQVAMIKNQEMPSYDQGGISTKKGIYQTGNINEAHIPLKDGKVPVSLGTAKYSGSGNKVVHINYIMDNPTFTDQETLMRTQAAIASTIATRIVKEIGSNVVINDYNSDKAIRKVLRGGR